MLRLFFRTSIALMYAVILSILPVSNAHAEPSDAEIAAGVAAAVDGGLIIGKAYNSYSKKKEDKKLFKKATRNQQQFKKDFASDPVSAKAKWQPRCQGVMQRLKAANCMDQAKPSRKCTKIAADCPL